jgi:dimethylhistidine N-methyltransferase
MSAPARVAEKATVPEQTSGFAHDILGGLRAPRKWLPAKYFYDELGSRLFERITTLPEYYPTRTELRILKEHAADIACFLPEDCALIELGSGSSHKVRLLLGVTPHIAAYLPVDISSAFMRREAESVRRDFPALTVITVEADFTRPFELPSAVASLPRAGFFPGSTIGNFEPQEARRFLEHMARMLGPTAVFIIGVDVIKDPAILHAAYNDAAGVTAQFNRNLLARINRELGANFDLDSFDHQAFYNCQLKRIEMHLVSTSRQTVKICGETFDFRTGETIHTENSYKYSVETFSALARGSGWAPHAVWTDAEQYFSVHVLGRAAEADHKCSGFERRRSIDAPPSSCRNQHQEWARNTFPEIAPSP